MFTSLPHYEIGIRGTAMKCSGEIYSNMADGPDRTAALCERWENQAEVLAMLADDVASAIVGDQDDPDGELHDAAMSSVAVTRILAEAFGLEAWSYAVQERTTFKAQCVEMLASGAVPYSFRPHLARMLPEQLNPRHRESKKPHESLQLECAE